MQRHSSAFENPALTDNWDDAEGYYSTETDDGVELDRFIRKGFVLNWEEPIDWEDEDVFDLLYDEFFLCVKELNCVLKFPKNIHL